MASLYLVLIIPTLSSSTAFLSSLCLTSEVQQTCHLTDLVLLEKCFQLLVIILLVIFLSACIQLSWIQAVRTLHRGSFTSTKILMVSYLTWKKIFMGIVLAFFIVRSHWQMKSFCEQLVLSVISLSQLFPSGVFKKNSLVIEMLCNNNVAFYPISNTLAL